MGRLRQQSPGQVLQVNKSWKEATRTRDTRLAGRERNYVAFLIVVGGGLVGKLRALWSRLRSMVSRGDSDLTDELESVVQMYVDDSLRAGMTPKEARRQALIRLGGVEQVRQAVRDRTGLP